MEHEEKYAILKSFGENLRRIRQSKGMSQSELHYQSNLGKNAVGRLERGEVNPTLLVILELSRVLEIEPVELLKKTP